MTTPPKTPRSLSAGKQEYEARRAAKAGLTLDKHLAGKEKQAADDARIRARAAEPAKPAKPPGMLRRLIDRAHQPLKPETTAPGQTRSAQNKLAGVKASNVKSGGSKSARPVAAKPGRNG